MIELKNLNKVFKAGNKEVKAVDGINLSVPEGSIYGVIGSSGAGKSTLIRCVNLLERPTSGQVMVDGQDLMQLNDRQLRDARRNIGMIFQHFNLLSSRTVFDNIALPLELAGASRQAIDEAVLPLLELTGLSDKRDSYPSQLSGGQKQRVAIARALASKPKVLLCDEATSALDPQTTASILALLKDINRQLKITVLIITHEMDVVKSICDRVAILSHGCLIEENDVEQFFLNPKTELAREFVRSAIHEKPVAEVESRFQQEKTPGANPVIRITFVGQRVVEPLITQAARKFDTDFVILQADIETVHDKVMGFLMVEVTGDEPSIEASLDFLSENVQVEVVGYVG
ncbi:DL-methionine transporter ATP-binding subunit [Endozoicomonas montiporae]|uniref:DL-methionine transporter ATP-binding subunit n=2 Tax=Endozoicomonas montiporae TaxID=1027273 RepID=A0A081N607_9GAMM|nr:methionine ABC transporter ATP-binding protein [Endozoicomonas montiporae]AMO57203.1 D-methionine ABC transporter ATP-binding protein [Endozoicomonas montiporae CL-33]KEQ13880.1 DL-methionine transporter ATP-binding subunit [Endozoicomonas montiporae]